MFYAGDRAVCHLNRFLELVVGGDVCLIKKLDLVFMVINFEIHPILGFDHPLLKVLHFFLQISLKLFTRLDFLLLTLEYESYDFRVGVTFRLHICLQRGHHYRHRLNKLSPRVNHIAEFRVFLFLF